MKVYYSATLYKYIAINYLKIFGIIFFSFCLVVFLGDLLELSRKAAEKDISFFKLCELALLKMPKTIQKLIAFCVMLSTVLLFAKFSRTSELVIFKASGLSVFGYVMPSIIVAFGLGVLLILFINPLSSVMLTKFTSASEKYLGSSGAKMSIGGGGIWLKQTDKNSKNGFGKLIINAKDIDTNVKKPQVITLLESSVFYFSEDEKFLKRIDAKKMEHKNNNWFLTDVLITNENASSKKLENFEIPTDLTLNEIYDSFTPPENINFFELQKFISVLERAGFSALPHKLEFYNILFSPLLFMAMVLFGTLFSFSHVRSNKQSILITYSVLIGFVVYFFINLIFSFGLSGKISIIFASFIPIVLLAGVSVYLLNHYREV